MKGAKGDEDLRCTVGSLPKTLFHSDLTSRE